MKKLFCILFISTIYAQRVVGYYPQWVQDGLPPSDIDFNVITHVNHSFAWPDENGNILSYSNMLNASTNQTIHNAGGKILLSLGGWGNDVGFATVAASPELRLTFIENLLDICDTYGYDGIDMDWEHPWSNEDRQNLNDLIFEMDSIFNDHDPELLITMAVPISNWAGQWYDFSFLVSHIDFFNAMTYEMHGSWSNHAGHNAPLFQSPPGDPDGSCSTGITYLTNTRGIPESKINLGLPFWGKKWTAPDINEPFTGDVIDLWYYEIPDLIGNGWTYHWDSNAFCPYLIKDDQSTIITYDDHESIGYKCDYAYSQDLGGVMIWALGYDVTENGQELVQSIEENYLKVDREDILMAEQVFLKAYPNPFNSNCVFEFELLKDQFVKLDVYSIKGQFLLNLNNENLGIGKHSLAWNAKNFGRDFGSGVFFVVLDTENKRAVQKVLYLK